MILPAQRPRRFSRRAPLTGSVYGCVVKQECGVGVPKRIDDIGAGVGVTLAVIEDGGASFVLGSRPIAKRVLLKRIRVEKRILSGGGSERKRKRLMCRARSVYKGTVFECAER